MQYLIYDFYDVELAVHKKEPETFIDLLNIEEELLNPKWYSDFNSNTANNETVAAAKKTSQKYEELVEAVTPFVQFKENVKANNTNVTNIKCFAKKINNNTQKEIVKLEKPTIRKIINPPIAKRRLSVQKVVNITPPQALPVSFATAAATTKVIQQQQQQQQSLQQQIKPPPTKQQKLQIVKKPAVLAPPKPACTLQTTQSNSVPTSTTSLAIGSTIKLSNVVINPIVTQTFVTTPQPAQAQQYMPKPTTTTGPTKEKQTAQILNKLQNLGLQVKRTQPVQALGNTKTDNKTLEILQKLQSKGMKVKILNKQAAAGVPKQTTAATNVNLNNIQNTIVKTLNKTTTTTTVPVSVSNTKSSFSKNLIIRKVN